MILCKNYRAAGELNWDFAVWFSMKPIRDYRADAERLRHAAREATPEGRGHLLQLAELYEGLAKANDKLARTPWPSRGGDIEADAGLDLRLVPITIMPVDR